MRKLPLFCTVFLSLLFWSSHLFANYSCNANLSNARINNFLQPNKHSTYSYNNTHTLMSGVYKLEVAEVPTSEYNSLKEIYNSTQGEYWTYNTNWLDTTNSSVEDWYGITVEDGHVTKIELSGNNLQEAAFDSQLNLPELRVLDISDNLIDDANFDSLDSLKHLEKVKIENNMFIFNQIKQLMGHPLYESFSSNFSYSPQQKIDYSEDITLNNC